MYHRRPDDTLIRSSSTSAGVGLQSTGPVLRQQHPELLISKRKLRQAGAIQLVREKRDSEAQNLGFASRPFVLCGLPVKRPEAGCLLHEHRNGQFLLQITGHPKYGLPWEQDWLIPIFLATLAIRQQKSSLGAIPNGRKRRYCITFGSTYAGSPHLVSTRSESDGVAGRLGERNCPE